jgi:glycosyltransferase involved in cell wall biosynthesis
MKNDLISVVIPAYNVEEKINRCINSLLEQTYPNLEIIVVNDGSTDSTAQKCEQYSHNKQINYIAISNAGVSNARNVGMRSAKGKYITFVDADDYVEKDMLEKLVNRIMDSDLVICGKNVITKDAIIHEEIKIGTTKVKKKDLLLLYQAKILNPPYCKLYKMDIIHRNQLQFDTNVSVGEDLLFNLQYIDKIFKPIAIVKENLYYYEKLNANGLSEKYHKNMLEMKTKIVKEMKKDIHVSQQQEREFEIILFQLLFSSVTNEWKDKSKNLFSRYSEAYKKLKSKEIMNQIEKLKEKRILTAFEYRILTSYFYGFYIIFLRKRIK